MVLGMEIVVVGLEKASSKLARKSMKSGRKSRHFPSGGNETQEFRFVFLY